MKGKFGATKTLLDQTLDSSELSPSLGLDLDPRPPSLFGLPGPVLVRMLLSQFRENPFLEI